MITARILADGVCEGHRRWSRFGQRGRCVCLLDVNYGKPIEMAVLQPDTQLYGSGWLPGRPSVTVERMSPRRSVD